MAEELRIEQTGLTESLRAAVLDNVSDGIYFVDRQRRILYWNRAAERITGFTSREVIGRSCKDNILNHCDEAGVILCGSGCPLLNTIRDGEPREAHVFLHHRDGHRLPVCVRAAALRAESGEVIGAVETFYDDAALLDSRRRADDMRRASLSDPLTGVGNRRLGESVLVGWIGQYTRFERPFGLLYIDIDDFKRVNDRFGHQAGDEAIRLIARTLMAATRPSDEVIRWGGDEFVIVLGDADAETLSTVAQRMRMLVNRTRLVVNEQLVPLSISSGGTLAAPGDTEEAIMARADALLYESKRAGRDRVTLGAG